MNKSEAQSTARKKIAAQIVNKWAKRHVHVSMDSLRGEIDEEFNKQKAVLTKDANDQIAVIQAELAQRLRELNTQKEEYQKQIEEKKRQLGKACVPTDGIKRRIDLTGE